MMRRSVRESAKLEARQWPAGEVLRCQECGNSKYFLQHVTYGVNLVNGNMDHVHLFEADVNAYTCTECGAEVKPGPRGGNR